MENIENSDNISLLNLPLSILDDILKLLSPMELIRMSEVCTYLRNKCQSDHLWDNHIKKKWGRIIGDVAYKEWQWHITSTKKEGNHPLNQEINQKGSLGSLCGTWPVLCLGSYFEDCKHLNSSLVNNKSKMAFYSSLESGKFWFPAQVYKELYVSDALVSYDCKTDTFQARQRGVSWWSMGNNIQWDELRSSPVDTPPCVRHISDCFEDLKPGDHIEIQWKGSREIQYDWWYAVIGHLDSCNENENHCHCRNSETLVVEFKQYPDDSDMRRVELPKHDNGELGEDFFGFYGGIRKLHNEEEIEKWMEIFTSSTEYI